VTTGGPDPSGTAESLAREAEVESLAREAEAESLAREAEAESLAREAEADALAAEARAEAARVRAAELRRQLEVADAPVTDAPVTEAPVSDAPVSDGPVSAPPPPTGLLRTIAVAATTLLTAGLLGATGYMVWQHQKAAETRRSAAEFTAAARQDVINLMSMDYTKAQESVQRVLDNSTGKFRANFDETADEFARALRDEKIITTATINDAAVEPGSMTEKSAVVMVSATSQREGKQAPKEQQRPQVWRVVLTLEREGDQIKMSGVEFV
jgi:Mce-associated membrane protein